MAYRRSTFPAPRGKRMPRRSAVLLSLVLVAVTFGGTAALADAPPGGYIDVPHCSFGGDPYHYYVGSLTFAIQFRDALLGGRGKVPTIDACGSQGPGFLEPGDGDAELGLGGDQFPIYQKCLTWNDPTFGRH